MELKTKALVFPCAHVVALEQGEGVEWGTVSSFLFLSWLHFNHVEEGTKTTTSTLSLDLDVQHLRWKRDRENSSHWHEVIKINLVLICLGSMQRRNGKKAYLRSIRLAHIWDLSLYYRAQVSAYWESNIKADSKLVIPWVTWRKEKWDSKGYFHISGHKSFLKKK